MSSFINDEKGVIEPYTELPAMALAVVGFIVFVAVASQAYTAYQQKALITESYQDAANLAEKLSKDSSLRNNSRSDVIDAYKLQELYNNPEELMQKYSPYYNFMFKVEVNSAGKAYTQIIKNQDAGNSNVGISASIPVTVRFNDVQELPGTLTVKIWRK